MNPIKSIELVNFQSHQSTLIEPAPPGKLTVITGPSDSGKTAIIRALKWAFNNQPQGADFMRTGASVVRVNVKFADRNIVVRERTAATNRYKIIRPVTAAGPDNTETFEGFGSTVPLEVQEITGVRTVKIADQDLLLNLSEQLDPPFLGQKSTTAPGRAKILGKLAGTEEIDVAGADVGRDLYRRGQDEKRLSAEIEALGEQIEGFKWLEGLGKRILVADLVLGRVRKQREQLSILEHKRDGLLRIEDEAIDAKVILGKWSKLPAVEAAVKGAEAAAIRCKTLSTLKDRLVGISYGIEGNQETLYGLRSLAAAEEVVSGAAENFDRARQLHGWRVKLGQVDADLKLCRVELNRPRVIHVEQLAAAVKSAEDAAVRAGELAILKGRLGENNALRHEVNRTLQQWEDGLPDLEQDYFDELVRLGVCPTCGSTQFDISTLKEVV
jgi:exonuclease SbcC